MSAFIRLYNSSLTSELPIYDYGNSITYELNTLPYSVSQCGNVYFQPVSNSSIANIKRVFNWTIDYIDNDEKQELIDFYNNVEGSKKFSLLVTNAKENVLDLSTVIFNEQLSFNQPDLDWWNVKISIREV